MDNNQMNSLPTCSIIVHEDITDIDNIEERICPLCRCPLKLYQIHYDEKFLMCANINCAYPFGVTDYHIFKIECSEVFTRTECSSSIMSVTSGSTISNSDWSEIDRIIQADPFHPHNSLPPSLVEKTHEIKKLEELKESVKNEERMRMNVKKIKELNKLLFDQDEMDIINNEQWIEQIANMQERSGVQLLKAHELKKIKKLKTLGLGELQINIDTSGNAVSLKIEIPSENKKEQNQ